MEIYFLGTVRIVRYRDSGLMERFGSVQFGSENWRFTISKIKEIQNDFFGMVRLGKSEMVNEDFRFKVLLV